MAQYSIKMGPREENWKVNYTLEIQPDVIGEIFVQCGVLSFTRRSLELAVEQHRRSNFRSEVNSSRKVWGFCFKLDLDLT